MTTTPSSNQPFIALYRPTPVQILFALLATLGFVLCTRWEVLTNLTSLVLGGVDGDAGLYLWLTERNLSELFTVPWFQTSAFFPYGNTLAWSDNYILPSLAQGAIRYLGATPIAAHNLILLAVLGLNFFTMWLLIFALAGSMGGALIGALCFASSPFLVEHLGHPQLQYTFFLPLGALLWWVGMCVRPGIAGIALGVTLTAALLSSVYIALFLAIVIATLSLLLFIARPTRELFIDELRFSGGALLGLLSALPIIFPYLLVASGVGARGLHEPYYFAAHGLSFLASVTHSSLYSFSSLWSHAEARFFLGVTPLVLTALALRRWWEARPVTYWRWGLVFSALGAGVGSVWALDNATIGVITALLSWVVLLAFLKVFHRTAILELRAGTPFVTNRLIIGCFVGVTLLSALLALGPLGRSWQGEWALGVHRVFYELFPGGDGLRAIGRIGLVVQFGVAALAGLAASRLAKKPRLVALLPIIAVFILVETWVPRYALTPDHPVPGAFLWLRSSTEPTDVTAVLPLTSRLDEHGRIDSWSNFATLQVRALRWLHGGKGRTINGYSGARSRLMEEWPRLLADFPSEASLMVLARVPGMRYVVYRPHDDPHYSPATFEQRLRAVEHLLTPILRDESGNHLFELRGEVTLNPESWWLVPAYTEGEFVLRLRSLQIRPEPIPVTFFLRSFSAKTPLLSTLLPRDGNAHEIRVPIVPGNNPIQPLRIAAESGGVPVKWSVSAWAPE